MARHDLPENLTWITASSGQGGTCLEMARVGDEIAVRNSNRPEEGALLFTQEEIRAALDGADLFRQLLDPS